MVFPDLVDTLQNQRAEAQGTTEQLDEAADAEAVALQILERSCREVFREPQGRRPLIDSETPLRLIGYDCIEAIDQPVGEDRVQLEIELSSFVRPLTSFWK